MPRKPKRSFSAAEKSRILRRHHQDKVPISQICEEEDIQPSLFYYWQRQLFENLDNAFQPHDVARERELERKVAALEERLARKDAVIAQISEEFVTAKKALGET